SSTAQTRRQMALLAAENLATALTGGTPPNVVKELRS
ncbi:bifunctional glyoxylate/hydroxypyruvate reductase B, partial [Paenibacillus macerans]|nr:bifunctional glyoxylate/hydroxypyruvate reductase B [Paenibacillus macerans]